MQSGKNVMESAREAATNVAASAKAGMDKTKAVVEEKAKKMSTRDPFQKERAEERKEEKIKQANAEKQMTHKENAARKEETRVGGHPEIRGTVPGQPTSGPVGADLAGEPPVGTGTQTTERAGSPAGPGTGRSY